MQTFSHIKLDARNFCSPKKPPVATNLDLPIGQIWMLFVPLVPLMSLKCLDHHAKFVQTFYHLRLNLRLCDGTIETPDRMRERS